MHCIRLIDYSLAINRYKPYRWLLCYIVNLPSCNCSESFYLDTGIVVSHYWWSKRHLNSKLLRTIIYCHRSDGNKVVLHSLELQILWCGANLLPTNSCGDGEVTYWAFIRGWDLPQVAASLVPLSDVVWLECIHSAVIAQLCTQFIAFA